MRLDRLTVKAQEALADAQGSASESGQAEIRPLHLLDALLRQEGGLTAPLLEKIGIPPDRIRSIVSSEISRLPSQSSGGGMALSQALNAVFTQAEKDARQLKDEYTSVEHLLLVDFQV